jgi:butyryl-CoA dehydrogenase
MALTEPEAGSSLSDIQTKAYRTAADYYLIKGQKVFISCGDHDACNNIVHLMLARIEGAPAGTKGISLFVVPQKRIAETSELVFNDVTTAGIFHKMGYHGAPITHLIMGEKEDCRAWLIGEEHKGLSYMFQMMNEARIGVGLNATAIASAAYYHSLHYAKTRKQGRLVAAKTNDNLPVEIIQHPDIKRLLLFQKSVSEGALALAMQACMYFDLYKNSEGEEKKNHFLLLDLLTPIVKSYPAEMSIHTTSAGIQILGGYGYTNEYLAELFFRETRIHTIHEGTTAIHGLDLLGRKITQENGKAVQLLAKEINQTILAAKETSAAKYGDVLTDMLSQFNQLNQYLFSTTATKGAAYLLADASLYLELAGIIAIAWQWLKQAVVADGLIKNKQTSYSNNFLESKLATCNYFYEYECIKAISLIKRLQSDDAITVTMDINLLN